MYIFSSHLPHVLHYVAKHKNIELAYFQSSAVTNALPDFNQLLLGLFNHADSQCIITLLYEFLNLVVIKFHIWAVKCYSSVEMKQSFHCSNMTVLHATCTGSLPCLAERHNYHL